MHLYLQQVLVPYYKAQKELLGLPMDFPCIWIIDCWSVHIKDAFLDWVRKQYPFIRIVFIPANCTGVMQPCDLVGQRDIKCILRAIATLFCMVQLREALKRLEGLSEEEREQKIKEGALNLDTSTSAIKPLLPGWLLEAQNQVQARGVLIKGWEQSRLLEALDPIKGPLLYQLAQAKQQNGELWANTRAGGGGVAVPAHLERVKVAKCVENDAGETVVVVEEQDLPEPKESESDIADEKEKRDRCAAFAERVRQMRAFLGVVLTFVWVVWDCGAEQTTTHVKGHIPTSTNTDRPARGGPGAGPGGRR